MPDLDRPLLVYDGDCRFCRASARLIATLDRSGRLAFLPMHDERASPFVGWVPESDRFSSFHVIEPTGRAYSRGAAVIATLGLLRGTVWLGRILRTMRAARLVDLAYALVAALRGRAGRFVRDAPGPVRWP
jgi:predicted DCC family thiol-disulfide oxidoreductase YuxK